MSELGDTFKAFREESQKKRAANLEANLECLRARGHQFQMLSSHHVRICDYDFWPSTGKWINRVNKRINGRGILGLLAKLEPTKKRDAT